MLEDKVDTNETVDLRTKMMQCISELDDELDNLREAADNVVEKDIALKKAKATGFLTSEGKNADERKEKAFLKYETQYAEHLAAESDKEVCMESIRNIRAKMSAISSLVYGRRTENESVAYR
jgi:hypothetical protein